MSNAIHRREIDIVRPSKRLKIEGDGVDAQDLKAQSATIQQATLTNLQVTGQITYPDGSTGTGGGGGSSLGEPLLGSSLLVNTGLGGQRGRATIELDHTFDYPSNDIFDDHRNLNMTNAYPGLVAWTTRSNILDNNDICVFDYIHDHATGSFNIANFSSRTGLNYRTFLTLSSDGRLYVPQGGIQTNQDIQASSSNVSGEAVFGILSQAGSQASAFNPIIDDVGNLKIRGTATITNQFTAKGPATFSDTITKLINNVSTVLVDNIGNATIPGTLTSTGLATLSGGMSSPNGTFSNQLSVNTISKTLNNVTTQILDTNGNLTVPATLNTNKIVQTINGNPFQILGTNGNVLVPGTLNTTGQATFTTGSFSSTLSVNKIAQIINSTTFQILDAAGNVIIPGTLNATGLSTLNGGINSTTGTFSGNVTVGGTLIAPNIQTAVTISALYKGSGATITVANGATLTIPSSTFISAGTIYTNTSINSSNSAISITAPGNYIISYTVFSPSAVIGALQLYFTSSTLGTQLGSTSQYSTPGYVTVTYAGPLTAGDVITPTGINNSGSSIAFLFDTNCTYSISSLNAVSTPSGPNNAAAIFSQYPLSGPVSSTAGTFIQSSPQTYTDNTTAASSTAAGNFSATYLGAPTLRATNTAVTTSTASTLTIAGAPIPGTNETITNSYALNVSNGNSFFNGNVAANSLTNNSTVNTSIYKLIYSTTTTTSASVSVPNGSSKNITPSMVAVLPSPYSVQYTPATNCVFTVPTTSKWRFFFSGSWANSGANGAAGGYVNLRFDYTQGGNTYTEVDCVTQPGGNSYGHQIFLEGWFVKGDTVTPSVFNLSGNTMIFYFTSFVAVSNPF